MKNKLLKTSLIALFALTGSFALTQLVNIASQRAIAEPSPFGDDDTPMATMKVSLKDEDKKYYAGDEVDYRDFKVEFYWHPWNDDSNILNITEFDASIPPATMTYSNDLFFFTDYEEKVSNYWKGRGAKFQSYTINEMGEYDFVQCFGESYLYANSNSGFSYTLKEGANKIHFYYDNTVNIVGQHDTVIINALPAPKAEAITNFEGLNTNVSLGLSYSGDGTTDNPFAAGNTFLRFGVNFSKDIYDGLKAANNDADLVFGVEVNKEKDKGAGEGQKILCGTIARLDKDGNETNVAGDITNYQYALVIKGIPEEAFETKFYCRAYVVVGGKTYYANLTASDCYSVSDVAKYYVENMSEDEAVKPHIEYLKSLYTGVEFVPEPDPMESPEIIEI